MTGLMTKFSAAGRIWRRNFLHFRKNWFSALLWIFVEPSFYLLALGFGLGAYVRNMEGGSYIEFLFPGIVCMTAMMVAFLENTYGVFPRMHTWKSIEAALMAPLSVEDVVYGEIFWAVTKATAGGAGVIVLATTLGLVDYERIWMAIIVMALVAWLFSAFGLAMTAAVARQDSFAYFVSGLLIPMTLISGVYFPMSQMPLPIQAVAWSLPLSHATSAFRMTQSGKMDWMLLVHFGVLVIFCVAVTVIALKSSRRRFIR